MKNKKPYTTRPNVISFLYFLTIYLSIIIIGKFNKKKLILDFGSGLGYLKKINLKLRNPSKIVNYDKIVKLITKLVKNRHYNFLETLAEDVFDELFKDKRIDKIVLQIEKLEILKQCTSVGIQISKKRSHEKL